MIFEENMPWPFRFGDASSWNSEVWALSYVVEFVYLIRKKESLKYINDLNMKHVLK